MASIIGLTRKLATVPIRIARTPFTVAKQLRSMTNETSTIGQARRAFVEDMAGRAKAVLGFVIGDDRLLTTGQIERTKASERMSAIAEEAAAEVTEKKATQQTAEAIQEAERRTAEAERKARRRTAGIARDTAREQQKIEARAAQAERAIEREAAEKEMVIDGTDTAVSVEASRELVAAQAEEIAAETARAEAEAIEKARKEARSSGRQ